MTSKSSVFFKSQGPIPFEDFVECFVGVQWHELPARLGGPYLIFKNQSGRLMLVELRSYKGLSIGRSTACHVMIDDSSISRTHIQLQRQGEHWLIRDLVSSYGTAINGKELHTVYQLKSEDVIRVGKRVEVLYIEGSDVIPLIFNELSRRLNDLATGESTDSEPFKSWNDSSVA
ncbi:MAG: FHA domain-containing protein [Planctomycetota bacterium]|nr:FHA domain-containing protein [Planctomycetota bacterium]